MPVEVEASVGSETAAGSATVAFDFVGPRVLEVGMDSTRYAPGAEVLARVEMTEAVAELEVLIEGEAVLCEPNGEGEVFPKSF